MSRLLVLAVVLAGCAAPQAAPGPSAGPTSLAWGVDECAFVIVAVPVDEAALAAKLPEGFSLPPSRVGVLPFGPRATIELDAYQCASTTWGDVATDASSYGSFYTAVDAPDALREKGYDATFVKWDALVAEASARERLASLGLPARAGEASVAIAGPTVVASLDLEAAGGFRLTGTIGAAEPQGEPLPFAEFTPLADGGLARWHARLHDASIAQGTGVVELAPGWVRDLVGSDRAPATFIAGTWNLDEADVTLPIAWP